MTLPIGGAHDAVELARAARASGYEELWLAEGRRLVSLAIYLTMGWMGLVVMEPLVRALTWNGFGWLLAAGLAIGRTAEEEVKAGRMTIEDATHAAHHSILRLIGVHDPAPR